MSSEYTSGRPDDLTTGLETAYYDMAKVLDTTRVSRPSATAPGEDPTVKDWLHINQSYVNETNQPGESDIIDPQAGDEAMGLLILQEIAPTEKTVRLLQKCGNERGRISLRYSQFPGV